MRFASGFAASRTVPPQIEAAYTFPPSRLSQVRTAAPGPGFWLLLKAQQTLPIQVREHDGCPRAFRTISGREAILERIYVEAGEGGIIPSVRSISLFGIDADNGEPLRETIRVSS